jgi:hypothetical protein
VASVAWISVSPVKGLALRPLDRCELTEGGVYAAVAEPGRVRLGDPVEPV